MRLLQETVENGCLRANDSEQVWIVKTQIIHQLKTRHHPNRLPEHWSVTQ